MTQHTTAGPTPPPPFTRITCLLATCAGCGGETFDDEDCSRTATPGNPGRAGYGRPVA